MKQAGIYRLQFPTGHFYVGSSTDWRVRCRQHQNKLRRGIHDSPRMQHVYNKYGSLPIFGLVVPCMDSSLVAEEQHYLDMYVGLDLCLNISKCAEAARRGVKGKPHTDEWKELMSKKMRTRVFTEEHRSRISLAKKGLPVAGMHTGEARQKSSASRRGRTIPESVKDKISVKLLGHKPAFSKSVVLINTGQEFESIMLAQRETSAKAIGRACVHGYSAGRMPDGTPMLWRFK